MSEKSLPTRLASALARRVPPRRWPLLGLGLGIAIGVLALPGAETGRERHRESEILERLTAGDLDLEHGPRFWLLELERGTDLAREARSLCAETKLALRPGCRLLALLDEARGDGDSPPALTLPPAAPLVPDRDADLEPSDATGDR